jgi:hypothetical protein
MITTGNPGAPDDVVRVFVSYAREDRKWLDPKYSYSLIPFLVESLRRHNVVFWFDKELKPGDEFSRLIEREIDQSQIALLIVSQSFLNSEFIENKEMPRIAERARLEKMIVVPVLVEPCDWSEYPFLADRQMVPSSPLIDYTESPPQWVKVRFQILDGLKAQLKRIREVPQLRAQDTHDSVPQEIPSAPALSAMENAQEMPAATPEASNALEDKTDSLRQEQRARLLEPARQPETEPDVSRSVSGEPDLAAVGPFPAPVDIAKPAEAPTVEAAPLPSEQTGERSENWAKTYTEEREKVRIPRNWTPAAVYATALVFVAWVYLDYLWHRLLLLNWFLADMGEASLAGVLVCLLVFKPIPRRWALAVTGGTAATWLYLVFSGAFSIAWYLSVMGGMQMAAVLVCLNAFKPFPRKWTFTVAGGGAAAWVSLLYSGWFWSDWFLNVVGGLPLAVLVSLLVFMRRERHDSAQQPNETTA